MPLPVSTDPFHSGGAGLIRAQNCVHRGGERLGIRFIHRTEYQSPAAAHIGYPAFEGDVVAAMAS